MSIFKKIWEKIKSIFKKPEKPQCDNHCECSCHIESDSLTVNEKSDIELKSNIQENERIESESLVINEESDIEPEPNIQENEKTTEMPMEESSHEERDEPGTPVYYGMTRAQLIEKIKEKNYGKGISRLRLSELRRIYEQLYEQVIHHDD